MSSIATAIIPTRTEFFGTRDRLDLEAICVYAALGFFLDTDTFWVGQKSLPVASDCEIDENGTLVQAKPYFRWQHSPRDITLSQAVDEFSDLFECIVREQTLGKNVILPLSGGIDSRTQAAALKCLGTNVTAYSYSFTGGHDETGYSREIAKIQGFPFHRWRVEPGYLWGVIDELAAINGCYSEFTHPRQMAFIDRYSEFGDVFSLGHWGDVLFDDMGVKDDLSFDQQVDVVLEKIVKKSGIELGKALWKTWGLTGDFDRYLSERIAALLRAIDIQDSANARIRAFKSMYWAPRWTSVNLSIFERVRPATLPYYDNRMCEFICSVPESFLSGRRIQIEYIKRRAPKLARVIWQDHRPFNLLNYQWDKTPWNVPARLYEKLRGKIKQTPQIQRNWELQFLGEDNDRELQARLFNEPNLSHWIPARLVQEFYDRFKIENPVTYSHSVSMLLTLGLFSKHFKEQLQMNDRQSGPFSSAFETIETIC